MAFVTVSQAAHNDWNSLKLGTGLAAYSEGWLGRLRVDGDSRWISVSDGSSLVHAFP